LLPSQSSRSSRLPQLPRLPQPLGIKRYDTDGLAALLASWGEPAYRTTQLLKWLYMRSVSDYAEMTDLPATLRARLATDEPLVTPEVLRRQVSRDGTRKYLLRLADGACVEAVGIPSDGWDEGRHAAAKGERDTVGDGGGGDEGGASGSGGGAREGGASAALPGTTDARRGPAGSAPAPAPNGAAPTASHPLRLTVCFSTQVGCAMGCAFCATGTAGLTRSLAPGEMVDQVALVSRDFGARVTNAVAMGEGEPFANYEATLGALRIMNSPQGLGIGARHLTVSTCGLLKPLRRFSLEPEQFTLAISLHSAVQATRDALMPALAAAPLAALRTALASYGERTGRRPSLEFTLIAGVNDTPTEVAALIAFARGMLCHVNLIPLNETKTAEGVRANGQAGAGDAAGDAQAKAGRETAEGVRASDPLVASGRSARDKRAGDPLVPSPPARRAEILAQLQEAGIECSLRRSRGADIASACGQLKGTS
jgi:adenine C2-methylase RlmN of 23S rRNA A2503 and tRNA A37